MVDFDLVCKVAKSLNMSEQEVMNTHFVELVERLYEENKRLVEDFRHLVSDYGELVENTFINASINDYCKSAHSIAKSKGWYDEPVKLNTSLLLIHAEVSEAVEALRKDDKELFEEELADIAIRLFDLCGYMDINLGQAVDKKMEKNRNRSYRHGGKLF